ncbi:MAG: hypothetical protein H6850_01855 [Alphaproteobacteria bacterium]|nr:MAG: hypothetical protein H6850_01855 [Alphaproteobacteria bacterium]
MVDYGLLTTIRDVLANDEGIEKAGLASSIHFTLPVKTKFPLILLDIDEIWEDSEAGFNEAQARINFRITIMSHMSTIRESLEIGSYVEKAINGTSMKLSNTHLANLRKTGNVIDLPLIQNPRSVQQFYQAVVWQKVWDNYG